MTTQQFPSDDGSSNEVNASQAEDSSFILKGMGGMGGTGGELTTGTYTDPRDGQEYGWVQHGRLQWMTQNLRYLGDTGDQEVDSDTAGGVHFWVAEEPDLEGEVVSHRIVFEELDQTDPMQMRVILPDNSRADVQLVGLSPRVVRGYSGTNVAEAQASPGFYEHGVFYTYYDALGVCPSQDGWRLPSVDFEEKPYYELECSSQASELEKVVCSEGWVTACADAKFSGSPECLDDAYLSLCDERLREIDREACRTGWKNACETVGGANRCNQQPSRFWGEWVELIHSISARTDLTNNSAATPFIFPDVGLKLRSEDWANGSNETLMNFGPHGYLAFGGIDAGDFVDFHGKHATRAELADMLWNPEDPEKVTDLAYVSITAAQGYDDVLIHNADYDVIWTGGTAYPVRCVREADY